MKFPRRFLTFFLAVLLMASSMPLTASAKTDMVEGIGFITIDGQRLYKKAAASSTVLDVTREDDCVLVIDKKNAMWYEVIYNGQSGYMYAGCLDIQTDVQVELGFGMITASAAKLRTGPNQKYLQMDSSVRKDEFYIVGFKDSWYEILLHDKASGKKVTSWVRSDLMELSDIPYQNHESLIKPIFYYCGETIGEITYDETEPKLDPNYDPATSPIVDKYGHLNNGNLLANAAQFVGTPYVYGGTSPSGFDCSGLVYFSMALMGRSIPRTSSAQYGAGYGIDRGSLAPGDLVFFGSDGNVNHVGIYAGGGRFLHAPNSGEAVTYSSLSGYWSSHYIGARRVT